MDLLEPLDSNDFCSFRARCGMVNCLPCIAATGFTGLSFLEGPLKDCIKFQKPNKNNSATRKGMPTRLFVLRSRPCSPEGGVKTPAVKPHVLYITLTVVQRWFKTVPSASGLIVFHTIIG